MIVRVQKIILLMIIISITAGCASQTETTADSNNVSPITTIRDLHNVRFHLVDQNKTPIYNAFITANYNSSAYPNDLYTPNNNRGYTDENGDLTFVMRGSIEYNFTISNLHDKQEIITSIIPISTEYSLQVNPTIQPTATPTQTDPRDNYKDYLGYQIAKSICSFVPYVNDALKC